MMVVMALLTMLVSALVMFVLEKIYLRHRKHH